MRPKVSIALCTCNGAKYLSLQLESYLVQTCLPDEIVVCDDCSQDETVVILNDFARRAPFSVRVLVNDQNIGSTKNFEKSISLCSGEIIFLSDQDDVWMPNKIERVSNEFDDSSEVGMVYSDAELVDETLKTLGHSLFSSLFNGRLTFKEMRLIERGELFSVLLKRNIATGATMAFRAKYKNAIIPIPNDIPRMIHDGWIAMIISVVAKGIFLDERLIKYRQHGEQQIGATNYVQGVFKMAWKDAMERMAKNHKAEKEYVELLKHYITSRVNAPDHVLKALNAEIQYQLGYIRHYQLRKELPDDREKRFWPVIRELLSGRYHCFSNGIRSAIRDFVVDHTQETVFYEMVDKRKAVIH